MKKKILKIANIKRMPPTHINDYLDVPKPKLTSKYKPHKKTLKDEIVYQVLRSCRKLSNKKYKIIE